jgi:tRNA (guanine26-N2/guanine27-N2)-dimethyltransferase
MFVKEGSACIKIGNYQKISKEMDVFYNPNMKLNRDISILLLNSLSVKEMQIALPLAASGIRGIRFILELDKGVIKNISINDRDKSAFNSIKANFKLNKIKSFSILKNDLSKNHNKSMIRIYNEDANLFLQNSSGFDYIDIDPFGSSNPYLDSAIKRISRNGILAVTNTDTAALTGTYPKVCLRKYWAKPKLDHQMHETGLRILIRKIQLIGIQYDKALFPIYSYFKEHYFRIFFRCVKGKKECDKIVNNQGIFNDSGPMWLGSLWDHKLASKMLSLSKQFLLREKEYKLINTKISTNDNSNDLLKLLELIKNESKIDSAGFMDMHNEAAKAKKKVMIKKSDLINKIKKRGYKAAGTHFKGTGIRTDMKYELFSKLY